MVNKPMTDERVYDSVRILLRERVRLARVAHFDRKPCEECLRDLLGPVAQDGPDVALQRLHKALVALGCHDREGVHLLQLGLAQGLQVLTLAVLVHAQAQTAPHLLALARLGVRVLEGADLEHVGVVPALAQSRVTEDEPRGLVKGEQALLVLEYQVVGTLVVRLVTAALDLGVDGVALLVYGEVALVGGVGVYAAQVLQVVAVRLIKSRVKRAAKRHLPLVVVLHRPAVLLLEDAAILPQHLVAVRVVLAVAGHLVYEEE